MVKEIDSYKRTARNKRNLLPSLFPQETFSLSNFRDARDNYGYGNVIDRITRFLALGSLQETIDKGLFISPAKLGSIFFCLDVPNDIESIKEFLGKKHKDQLDRLYHRTFLDGTVLWEAQLASSRVIKRLERETQTAYDDVVDDLLIDIRADSKQLLETGQMTTDQASRELKNYGFSPLIRATGSNIFNDVLGAELTPRQILELCKCSPLPLERLLPVSQQDFSKTEELAIFCDENKSENLQQQLVSNGLRMGHIPFIIDRPLTDSEMVHSLIDQFKKMTGCQNIDVFKTKYKKQLSKRKYYIPFAELLFDSDSVFTGEKEMEDQKKLIITLQEIEQFTNDIGLFGNETFKPLFFIWPEVKVESIMDKFVRVHPLHTDTQITQKVVNGIIFDSQQPEIISDFEQLKNYFLSFSDRREEIKRLNRRLTVLGEKSVLSIPEGENCLGIVKKSKTKEGTVVEIETTIDRSTKKPVKVRFLYDTIGKFVKVQYFAYEKPQNLEDRKGIFRDQPLYYYLQDTHTELPSIIKSIIDIASVDEREQRAVTAIQKHIKN